MRFAVAASLALLLSSAAFADDDPMAARYGNTIIVRMPQNGPIVHMYYNADHTFSGRAKMGQPGMADFILHGTWKIEGDKICNDYNPIPPGQKNPACNIIGDHKLGDTWMSDGRTITLVPGVQ